MKLFIILVCFVILLVSGCNSGGNGDGDNNAGSGGSGISGFWTGTGTYHLKNGSMTFTMNLNLNQSGTLVTGAYHIERPNRTMDGSISGTISGSNIQMTFNPHGNATGTVGGGVMNLNFFEDWGGGDGLNATISLGKQ